VDAVVYYRVVDPVKAIINVQNYPFAVSQTARPKGTNQIQHMVMARQLLK
jgi:regulator of protease activity HflC (stomatin/prohibitin superfamily)